jgi:primosomal replication protein N
MRKTLGKVVLAVVIAGLLTGGIAIVSAATKVRTVTTPQGTTVDVISVTGTVTEVSTAGTTGIGQGIMGMFRRGHAGYAKIKDSTDGTVYTLELGREEAAGITMKVGDTVTVEGNVDVRNSVNELQIWTFTGADGKTVTLRKADGTPNVETVSVAGTVTEVNVPITTTPSTGDTTKPVPKAMATIKIQQADSTIVTVVLGHDASSITVKVGDVVTVEGFKTPMDASMIMATSFTGADGKVVTLRNLNGMDGGRGIQDESVSVAGTVAEVNVPITTAPSTGDTTKPALEAMTTIKVKQADGTVLTVLLGRDASSITVKVGDAVKVEGFKTSTDANTIRATSFTGADGKTVTLGGKGFGGCGTRDGQGAGRGFHGGMMGPGSASDSPAPSKT